MTLNLDSLIRLLHQSFSGNEKEIHESEEILVNIPISIDFCYALFSIVKNHNIQVEIRYAALIKLIHIVKHQWMTSLSPDVKCCLLQNYQELLFNHGNNLGKLFHFFSDLIVDAALSQNDFDKLMSFVTFESNNLIPSLILSKSISLFLKRNQFSDNLFYQQFSTFFYSSAFTLFKESDSLEILILIGKTLYFLFLCEIPKISETNYPIFMELLNKIIAMSSKLIEILNNQNEREEQRKSELEKLVRILSKIFFYLVVKKCFFFVPNELQLTLFQTQLQLFTKYISPSTREKITKLINQLSNLEIIDFFILHNSFFICEQIFLPLFQNIEINENESNVFNEISCFYEPIDSAIYLIQEFSYKIQHFKEFINKYASELLQQYNSNFGDNEIGKINDFQFLTRIKLASSSLQLCEPILLQKDFFESKNMNIRFASFVISANFQNHFLPSVLLDHFFTYISNQNPSIHYLVTITILKIMKNCQLNSIDQTFVHKYLPFLYRAYLSISHGISSVILLKKLLDISQSFEVIGEFSMPVLASLLSNLIDNSNDQSNVDGILIRKTGKRISQVLVICCDFPHHFFDEFIGSLITIFPGFNDFLKEIFLNIFQTYAEYFFSSIFSWEIVRLFTFDLFLEDEMKIFKNILISSREKECIEITEINLVLNKLFEKLFNHIQDENYENEDEEIILSSISDIIMCIYQSDNELLFCMIQKIIPFLLFKINKNHTNFAISKLISCLLIANCFLINNGVNINLDFSQFLNAWIAFGEFPFFSSSAIFYSPFLIQDDSELFISLILKVCDEINESIDSNSFLVNDFHEFQPNIIVLNFLKLIKNLRNENPPIFSILHRNAADFLDEKLPDIIDLLTDNS
ncbi:hypothetical protein TRFO_19748 [Tritrichomonas foetus]|uniref:Importin N-terminal domain-containing protein n=1 Tax=Tritrichomonas foetus TaxID=1144522 RepID=A0A1J4KN86_9EUKA|nr:hypothetical protein TRFO_19748 [Tritrichomonas foetus]|eukprot:OHT10853.1 hypothetical protein TRFO_19748 [Tritrichomonas foetus]